MLLPFIFGILVARDRHLPVAYLLVLIGFSGIALLVINLPSYYKFRSRALQGLLVNLLVFLAGCIAILLNDIRNRDDWIGHQVAEEFTLIVRIEVQPEEKRKTFKAIASVVSLVEKGRQISASGKIILYLPKSDTIQAQYGSELIVHTALTPITNSGSFDYKKYCALQNIYHQVFLKKNTYRIIGTQAGFSINAALLSIQEGIVYLMEKFVGGKEAGLAEALLIGYRQNLDRSMLQEYSDSGIIHVVAISGMHLGLIYWMLSLVISVKDWKGSSWQKPLMILLCLWIFTLVAGASASVVRSAVMFSFLLVGEAIQRRTSVYNTLAGSAFFLLCFNPFWLWDLGFQLSYLAVLSIVIFMKPIYDLAFVQNKLLDNLWKMVATTLAAQILTTPLTIFYFQRFPVYFLVTNIVAIPLSSLVVAGEVVLCMISPLPQMAAPLGDLLSWLIMLMNSFVVFMNTIPFGSIRTSEIDKFSLALIYAVIIISWFWLRSYKPIFIILLLVCLNVFILHQAITL